MNELKVFESEQFGKVRTTMINNEPWFVAADVCRALEVGETHVALRRLDEDEKGRYSTPTPGGNQEMSIVNEPGLYSLALSSRKKEARAFKRWITHEVIPSIRKTGGYTLPDKSAKDEALKQERVHIMARNARSREAEIWMKIANLLPESPQHRQVCASYASEVLTGQKVIALPEVPKTYSAEEVGRMYGISANQVGRIANVHGLKTQENGILVLDKSRHSNKEVSTFRYNERGAQEIGRLAGMNR